jgi:hypothetical protein
MKNKQKEWHHATKHLKVWRNHQKTIAIVKMSQAKPHA